MNRLNLPLKLVESSLRTDPSQTANFMFSHCALLQFNLSTMR